MQCTVVNGCTIIKLCCYVIRSARSPKGSQRPPGWQQVSPGRWLPEGDLDTIHQISRGESAAAGLTAGQPCRWLLGGDLVDRITSLNVSNWRFQKPVMFWRWHHHAVALWRHGRGARHNCLLLTTATSVNCPRIIDLPNHVIKRDSIVTEI